MDAKRKRKTPQPEAVGPDPVELASMDSFPASDPPSWIPVHFGSPVTAKTPDRPAVGKVVSHAGAPLGCSSDEEQPKQEPHMPSGARRRPPQ